MNQSESAATAQTEPSQLLEVDAPDSFLRHAWTELRKRKLALIAVCVLLIPLHTRHPGPGGRYARLL